MLWLRDMLIPSWSASDADVLADRETHVGWKIKRRNSNRNGNFLGLFKRLIFTYFTALELFYCEKLHL